MLSNGCALHPELRMNEGAHGESVAGEEKQVKTESYALPRLMTRHRETTGLTVAQEKT